MTHYQAYHLPQQWKNEGKDLLSEFKHAASNVERSISALEADCEFLKDKDRLPGGVYQYVKTERSMLIEQSNEALKLLEKQVRLLI